MIPELGHFALILAALVALVLGTLPLLGAQFRNAAWVALARPAAGAFALLVALAFACLTYAFAVSDFSVAYVAQNSNSLLPMEYRIAAVWGGHEGSLLLWMLMLAGWTLAVALLSRQLPDVMTARVLGTLGLVAFGFLLFILFTSNPFERLLPAVAEGRDLNPMLQDPGLVIHPPLLYMGYVGFSVAFAFAIAALLSGQLDAAWARWSRPWTTAAWIFLTLGIAVGSGWAYYELGWGGWWFWDPVENASFMPWLVGTALMHSLAVTEKRGSFKNWTVLLAISAFSLSLLGTFLVRSGVLTSVHAFAADPSRGIFILAFLVAVIGLSLALFAWRAPSVGLGGRFGLISRESMLLTNNVLLVVASATVLLGTLYPLLVDALGVGKISVGPPYFNAVFVPVMAPVLFLLGLGPFARWKEAALPDILRSLRWAFVVGVVLAIILPLVYGQWHPMTALGLLLAGWIAASVVINFIGRVRQTRGADSFITAALRQPRSFFGMHLAHLGVAVFVIGVTMVMSFEEEKDVKLDAGEAVTVADYTFTFVGVHEVEGPNYVAYRGQFTVRQGDRALRTLLPEKRNYFTFVERADGRMERRISGMPMTEAAIDAGLWRDVYVSLGEPIDSDKPEGAWAVRVYHKPFVDWIWGGCLLMALGGLFAMLDRRYRPKARRAAHPFAGSQPA